MDARRSIANPIPKKSTPIRRNAQRLMAHHHRQQIIAVANNATSHSLAARSVNCSIFDRIQEMACFSEKIPVSCLHTHSCRVRNWSDTLTTTALIHSNVACVWKMGIRKLLESLHFFHVLCVLFPIRRVWMHSVCLCGTMWIAQCDTNDNLTTHTHTQTFNVACDCVISFCRAHRDHLMDPPCVCTRAPVLGHRPECVLLCGRNSDCNNVCAYTPYLLILGS